LTEEHHKLFTTARENAKKEGVGRGGITKSYLSYCLGAVLDNKEGDDTIIFNEYPVDHVLVPRRRPNSWFENSNASGLGWSFGACVGGKASFPLHAYCTPKTDSWNSSSFYIPVISSLFPFPPFFIPPNSSSWLDRMQP